MDRRDFIKTASVAGAVAANAVPQVAGADTSRAEYRADAVSLSDDFAGDLQFSLGEFERRHARIRSKMEEREIDVLLITGNREWVQGELGNLRYVGIEQPPWEIMYVVFPREGEPIIPTKAGGLTPGYRNTGVVEFEYEDSALRPGATNSAFHGPAIARTIERLRAGIRRIGLVSPRVFATDVYQYLQDELPGVEFVDAEPMMLDLRAIKSAEEIIFLRRSGYIADKGIEAMIDSTHVGANDLDIVYAIDLACANAGAPPGGFQIYRSGPWGQLGPNVWSDPRFARALQESYVLIPEVGSNYKGYFTQLTVPVTLGDPGAEFYEALELNRAIYDQMLSQFRPGKTVRELDGYCADYCLDISNGKFTTLFAVQCGEHERAFIHDDFTLQPGMLGYIQPYFIRTSGEGGPFHVLGDAVVCTEDEPQRLHQSKLDLVVI